MAIATLLSVPLSVVLLFLFLDRVLVLVVGLGVGLGEGVVRTVGVYVKSVVVTVTVSGPKARCTMDFWPAVGWWGMPDFV